MLCLGPSVMNEWKQKAESGEPCGVSPRISAGGNATFEYMKRIEESHIAAFGRNQKRKRNRGCRGYARISRATSFVSYPRVSASSAVLTFFRSRDPLYRL